MSTLPKGFVIDEESINESVSLPDGFEIDEKLSFIDQAKGIGQHFGRRALGQALAAPKTLADVIKFGSNWLAQQGVEQKLSKGEVPSEEGLKITQTFLKGLGFPSELLDKIHYPDVDEMEGHVRDFYEFVGGEGSQAPLEPRTKLERGASTVGDYVGGSAIGGVKKLGERLLMGALGGTG